MNSTRPTFRFHLLRWHRRAGLLVAVFVLLLSVTGLLLNHSDELKLDEHFINSEWLLEWYGVETAQVVSYPVGEQWITDHGGAIYLGNKLVESCRPSLAGATLYETEIIVACGNSLSLITRDGQVVERVDATLGLPVPIDSLAMHGEQILLASGGKYFELDLDQLKFSPAQGSGFRTLAPDTAPEALINEIQTQTEGHSIHWERLLLDLHSGRLFGRAGVYLFDAAAVLLIFLALSGFYYWASKPASRR